MQRNSFLRPSVRRLLDALPHILPKSVFFDRLVATILFLRAHRRWPSKNAMLINDYLHRMKIGTELDDVLRQYVSDKELAKYFINYQLGYAATPETYAVFNGPEEFTTEGLNKPCVLKPAHMSGGIVYYDPAEGLTDAQRDRILRSFEIDWYRETRERNYKNLRRRVIAEELVDEREAIMDYKVFCVDGEPRLIQADHARHTNLSRVLYTPDWEPLDFSYHGVPRREPGPRPHLLPKMLDHARRLSAFFSFLRVDCYLANERLYVGELTNCHTNALNLFDDIEQERALSRHLFGPHSC